MRFFNIIKDNDFNELETYLKNHDVNEEIQGQRLLYWAVFHNRFTVVKRLIEKGADINHKDKLGRTPFCTSIFYNFTDVAKLLLDNQAKVESSTMDRALFGWNSQVQMESIRLLQEYGWVNLYLDDLRDIPDGFIGARTMEEAIGILDSYKVHILSLDHDLGMDGEGNLRKTGYDLVKYICGSGKGAANRIYLHTDNIVGRDNMYQTLLSSRRRGFLNEDIEIYPHPFIRNKYSGKEK